MKTSKSKHHTTQILGVAYSLLSTVALTSCSRIIEILNCKIFYDGNGHTAGSVPVDSRSYSSGSSATIFNISEGFAKTGYVFDGWNTASDGSGTTYQPLSSLVMGSLDLTLYAKWSPPSYYVSTTGNDTTGTGTVANPFATLGKAFTEISNGIALGQYRIYITGGTYNLSSGLSFTATSNKSFALYGGYDSTFSNRDTGTHETLIQDFRTGDSYTTLSINASDSYDSEFVIDGMTIQDGTIQGTPATTSFKAIEIASAKNVKINQVTINMDYSYFGNAIGIMLKPNTSFSNQTYSLTRNKIAINNSPRSVLNISGIETQDYTTNTNMKVYIDNNLIHIPKVGSSSAIGLKLFLAGTENNYYIRNNTVVFAGKGVADISYSGFYNQNDCDSYSIENNIFQSVRTGEGIGLSYKISNAFNSLKNNNIYDVSTVGYHHSTTTSLNLTQLNSISNSSNNVSENSNFTDITSDWSITPLSTTHVQSGGLDGSSLGWSFTTDITGAARTGNGTTGWTIGAYERD